MNNALRSSRICSRIFAVQNSFLWSMSIVKLISFKIISINAPIYSNIYIKVPLAEKLVDDEKEEGCGSSLNNYRRY